jgi:hypothetical protein
VSWVLCICINSFDTAITFKKILNSKVWYSGSGEGGGEEGGLGGGGSI